MYLQKISRGAPKVWDYHDIFPVTQAKTHFLSHFGVKKEKNMARLRLELTMSKSKAYHAKGQ